MPDLEHQQDLRPGESALSVDRSVETGAKPRRLPRRRELSLDQLVHGLEAGDRAILGRAVTLVESGRADHQRLAGELLSAVMPRTGQALRVGITGVPGVGKSTFIEALGTRLTEQGRRVAVLAVDPSSAVSGGSILGDKTRMAKLSADPRAFIRPSPAGVTLGGVAAKTREAMLLCEAAGFDTVLVETVGVGQSETAVADMTDVFLALMLAGAGDELQGIKRGLLELIDVMAINKADGDNLIPARKAASQYRSALHVLQPRNPGWAVPIETCSAYTGQGIDDVWGKVTACADHLQQSGLTKQRRQTQAHRWMWSLIDSSLAQAVRHHAGVQALLNDLEDQVTQGQVPPTVAARRVLSAFLTSHPAHV